MVALALVLALQAAAPAAPPPATQPPAASGVQTPGAGTPPGAGAQTPAASAAAPGEQTAPTQPEGYAYDPGGRRDPFLNLLGTGSEARSGASRRTDGPAGLTAAEISVRGILQSRGTLIAMIKAPDNKTYVVHQGDRLLDGTIKAITPQGLVILQEVNDPLSLVKQREVRKYLRAAEDVKQ